MKNTKRSLLGSVLALLLCFAMLIGSTFAWFTDSVTSAKNKIVAGNLDVELEYLNADGEWTSVEGKTDLFDQHALWEPGHTEVVYLRVVNLGTLALKYRLGLNIADEIGSVNVLDEEFKLSDFIQFGAVKDVDAPYADRKDARDAVTDARPIREGYTKENAIKAGDPAQYVALVVYMPEDVGNGANYKTGCAVPRIELGVTLVATQMTDESDDFGDTYDEKAEFPQLNLPVGVTVPVTPTADGKVSEEGVEIAHEDGSVIASLAAGTQLEEGTTALTLTVTDVENSQANVTAGENEVALSVDVHITGVAKNNTTPIKIYVKKMLPAGLNIGNYHFYHVENGVTVEMTLLSDTAEPDHNYFDYDPATGDVVLYMATFSEVAVVADTENAWEGEFDYSWYDASATELTIANADQLAAFGAIVGGMNGQTRDSFSGKTVKLLADINLGDEDNENKSLIFYPIGYYYTDDKNADGTTGDYYSTVKSFEGTFDGNGNKISNFYQNTWEIKGDYDGNYYSDAMGLFGAVFNATIKNLTVDNFQSDGEFTPTGCIAAYAGGTSTFENISLTNCNPRVYNTGNGGIVGLNYNSTSGTADQLTFKNITIDQTNKISALWGSYDVACGGILGRLRENSLHDGTNTDGQKNTVTFENCHVAAIMDVNNDCCANYQYYQYRYAGMMIGTVDYIGDVPAVGLTDVVTAKNCTVTYGDWNEYWYCELVANSLASYTHDHQFSRLTKISAVTDIQDENGDWNQAGNFVIPASDNSSAVCYHIVNENGTFKQHKHEDSGYETKDVDGDSNGYNAETGKYLLEDRQCYYIPFGQLFTGYGWGSSPVREYTGVTVADSGTVKSETKFASTGVAEVGENAVVNIGDLFKAKDGASISTTTVQVFVSPVGEDSTVSATYASNADWTKGTLTFTGTGTAKVVITDYFYCIETVLNITVGGVVTAIDKFDPKDYDAVAGSTVTLGELFSAKDGVVIDSASVNVTVSGGTYTANTEDWTQGTITFGEAGTATVTISATGSTETTNSITVTENDSFTTVFENTDKYLYRVGNLSAITLSSLFKLLDTATVNGDVTVTAVSKLDGSTVLTATLAKDSWLSGTIDFADDFTGVVAVTVDALGANPYTLNLEVVDAKNITSATGSNGTDVVLLNDVKIGSGATVTYENCFVYGNGFTFDARGGLTKYVASQGWGIINLSNGATLDNLAIVGDVYNTFGAYSSNDYNTAAVASLGGTIQNCHISHCAAPVMVRGTTTIKDTTLYGGTVANLIIKAGIATLENVVTVNNNTIPDRTMVGMGVVIHSDADDSVKLVINGTFKQYNFYSEADEPTDSNAKNLYTAMFDDSCSGYHFGTSPNRYVNTGIISMVSTFDETDISGTWKATGGYTGQEVTISGATGYVYTQPNTVGSVDNGYDETADTHKATVQGDYLPTFEFDLGDQEISYDGDTDSRYLYGDASGVKALYQDGDDAITLDITKLATVYKYTGTSYTVSAVCKDASGNALTVTNGVVTLSASGEYTLLFTVQDNIFYGADGIAVAKSVERTYTVPLSLSIKAADVKDAVITISTTTLEGSYVTVNLTDYKLKLEFLNCISVTDYAADNTAGSAVDLTANISSATFSVPSRTDGNVWEGASVITITYTDGRVLTVNLSDFEGSSPGTKTAAVVTNDGVYFLTDGALNNKPTEDANKCTCTITSVSFKGNNGATITNDTDVSVSWPVESSSSSGGGCVTADTLVTLADGTQKEIQYVTYEDQLLVWNFYTGEYTTAPASIVMNHGYSNVNVVTLTFADGTTVNTINGHGFFDVATNAFILLDASNAADYIGHEFVKQDGDGYTTTALVEVSVEERYTEVWSVLTAEHYNCILEGMWTVTAAEVANSPAWLMPYKIGEDMKYDEAAMQADIEKYGLYTYDDFADYCTYEQFKAFGFENFKVSVGKGYITWDEILYLIGIHIG